MGASGVFLNRVYYGYYLIAAAFVAQLVAIGAQNYVLSAFMNPMISELGWSRADFTLPRTIGQFVMAGVGFFIGALVDRHGPRRFMVSGLLLLGASIWACSQVESLAAWILLNGVALTAGAALIGNLVVNVTLAKWFVERRGSAVAWAAMGVSFAGILITPGVTWAIDIVGWRDAWQFLALFCVLLMVPVAAVMRRSPEDYGLHPDGRSDADIAAGRGQRAAADFSNSVTRGAALRTPTFYLLVLAFGLYSMGIGVMLLQSLPYVVDAGFSRSTGAWMITVASIPALLTKPVWGYFIDRMATPQWLAALSATLTGLAIAGIVLAQAQSSLAGLYLGFFAMGMGWGGMIPLQEVIWAGFFGRRYLGAVRGAAMPLALALAAAGPWGTSYYYDRVGNYDGAIASIAGLNLLSAVLIVLIPRGRERSRRTP